MDKGLTFTNCFSRIAKALLVSYMTTAVLLLVLAFLLYQFDLSKSVVNTGILVIYLLSCFLAGFLEGKMMGIRKYLWGSLTGLLYFLLLIVITLAMNHGFQDASSGLLSTCMLCIAGGTLGGMFS